MAVLKKSFVRYGYLKDESERSFVHQVMLAVVSTEWSDSAGKSTDLVRLELTTHTICKYLQVLLPFIVSLSLKNESFIFFNLSFSLIYFAIKFCFLKLALKTVAVFMLCWIPFSTCSLHMAIAKTFGGRSVEYSLFTLAFLNSVINPFIYFSHVQNAVSQQMRKLACCAFLKMRTTSSGRKRNGKSVKAKYKHDEASPSSTLAKSEVTATTSEEGSNGRL